MIESVNEVCVEHELLKFGRNEMAQLSEKERDYVECLLRDEELDDLYVEVARQVLGSGAMGEDPAGNGRRLFGRLAPKLVKKLCGNIQLRELAQAVDADSNDSLALVAVIASLIGSVVGNMLNVFLVSVLVLRLGLRPICEDKWNA